ncbi:hypothetical protein [Timonella senegalensis]|uniref:hypothetical protein n=1 Tax=Timonella senegalensis TaxID=1465825 RepID=UPI00031E2106|nr:hypothetical protein [Timonella senegalensis]
MQFDLAFRVATAGQVLGRLLVLPPSPAVADMFSEELTRSTWPLDDESTRRGLSLLADGPGPFVQIHQEFHRGVAQESLSGPTLRVGSYVGTGESSNISVNAATALRSLYFKQGFSVPGFDGIYDDSLGFLLIYLAQRAGELGRAHAAGDVAAARLAHERGSEVRQGFVDPVIEPLLESLSGRFDAPLWRAYPDLVRGFVDQHARLRVASTLGPAEDNK